MPQHDDDGTDFTFTYPFFERRDFFTECIQFCLVTLLPGPVILDSDMVIIFQSNTA